MNLRLSRLLVALCLLSLGWAETPTSTNNDPAGLLSNGHVDQAITVLKARTSSAPNDAEAWHLLSRSYYARENWDEAVEAGKRAVALNPSSSDYHLWLGRALGEKADSVSWKWWTAISLAKQARAQFEKAVELDASNLGAQSDLAEFYAEAPGLVGGGKDKARKQAELIQAKDASAAHWIKGLVAEKDKDFTTAEQEYRAAVTSSGGDGGRWLDLAAFYRRMERRSEMQSAITQAIKAPKKRSVVLVDTASILVETGGDLAEATRLLRQYLSSPAKTEEAPAFHAHFLLGSILEKQGQKQDAVAEYRAALALNSGYPEALAAVKRLQ